MTQDKNNKDSMVKLCHDFLHGALKPSAFSEGIRSYAQIRNFGGKFIFSDVLQSIDIFVEVLPEHVIHMFVQFLQNELPAQELHAWAKMLMLLEFFGSPEGREEPYGPMWEIIDEISCPEIDGPLTETRVNQYLEVLRRLKDLF